MSKKYRCIVVLAIFLAGGCAFHRADFVCGADGQPAAEVSASGHAFGRLIWSCIDSITAPECVKPSAEPRS